MRVLARSVTRDRKPSAKKPDGMKAKASKNNADNSNSSTKTGEKNGFAVISVKLRPAEKKEFKTICDKLGVSPNWAMRSMARQSAGFLELQKQTLNELQAVSRQLVGVATNINQIAKAGNRTLSPDYHAFMEDRRELGKELSRLQSQLQTILDVGKRRSDGLELLREVVAKS